MPQAGEEFLRTNQAYNESGGDIRFILRVLFNSDFFKNARFARVKGPAELVVGTARMTGKFKDPMPNDYSKLAFECAYQGQELLNPPSVESWHTGSEWIDSGALVRRVNFAVGLLGDTTLPGVRSMVEHIKAQGPLSPEQLLAQCLDVAGPLEASNSTRVELLEQAQQGGELRWNTEQEYGVSEKRIAIMLALIAASRDYQFA